MTRALAVFVAVVAFAALAGGCGTDAPLDVAQNVDLSRFQGKWYEIARLPRTTQTDCHGTTAFYTQGSGGKLSLVNQCNVGSTNGPLQTVTMTATVPDPSTPAKLALQVGDYSGDYWILEVGSNYEYAVIGHPSRLYLWILSRQPVLDSNAVQGIVERAQSHRFDTSALVYTPQPPPNERVTSDVPEGPVPSAPTYGCSTSGRRLPGGQAGALSVALAGIAVGLRRRRSRAGA